jgi:LDH2 family malate/lactate/ureidoglycolate dehydrogenase
MTEQQGRGPTAPGHAGTVDAGLLTTLATEVLAAAGPSARAAKVVAESLVDADLRGVHSHGVNRLEIYVRRLREGGNRADAETTVIAEAPALTLLDANDGLSQVASADAVEAAMTKAATCGCAVVSVRGGSHFGAAGYWARLLAEAGFLGLATTNTTPLMTAWGGTTRAIGTNPLAMAFPSSRHAPVVVDVATSETTWGKLINAQAAGAPIPDTWALDRDGAPTTDATRAVDGRRLLPFGRHKGYALAVGVELLAGALSGARCLSRIGDMYEQPERPMQVGHLFVAIDPAAIDRKPQFADAVAWCQDALNALPPRDGVDRVLWPGQLEAELSDARRAAGIPLPEPTLRELRGLADDAGVGHLASQLPRAS